MNPKRLHPRARHLIHQLLREPIPLYVFAGVVLGAWAAATHVTPQSGSPIRLASPILQLAGLVVAVGALAAKGTLFGRSHPIAMARGWVRRTFTPPREGAGSGAASPLVGAGSVTRAGTLDVTVGHRTLEERIEQLDAKVVRLEQRAVAAQDERLRKDLYLENRIAQETDKIRRSLAEDHRRTRTMAVGSYTWEWVGLGWIFVGTLLAIAEAAVPLLPS